MTFASFLETTTQISRNDTIWYGVPANDVPLCVACVYPGFAPPGKSTASVVQPRAKRACPIYSFKSLTRLGLTDD